MILFGQEFLSEFLSLVPLGAVWRTFVISLETVLFGASFIGYYFFELYRIKKREKAKLSEI